MPGDIQSGTAARRHLLPLHCYHDSLWRLSSLLKEMQPSAFVISSWKTKQKEHKRSHTRVATRRSCDCENIKSNLVYLETQSCRDGMFTLTLELALAPPLFHLHLHTSSGVWCHWVELHFLFLNHMCLTSLRLEAKRHPKPGAVRSRSRMTLGWIWSEKINNLIMERCQ